MGAQLLNFGALIAFMGVNLAALTPTTFAGADRSPAMDRLIPPVLGFIICLFIWIQSSNLALGPSTGGFTICFFPWRT